MGFRLMTTRTTESEMMTQTLMTRRKHSCFSACVRPRDGVSAKIVGEGANVGMTKAVT